MTHWLSVVGVTEAGMAGLSAAARAVVEGAEVLVGGERHLAMIPEDGRRRLAWPKPLTALFDTLAELRGRRVCVLASGDPFCYGVGTTLLRRFAAAELLVLPAPSAFSLAAARLGWSRPDCETLTLHGRPLTQLHPYVLPGQRLIALSSGPETPAAVAELLVARGYGASRLTVLERMDGPQERRIEASAADWREREVDGLNTLAIECVADAHAPLRARVPGLPDEAFRHDGQLTKREVRAVTLAALAPVPGQRLWDVGAGCGSVAIEWLRSHPRCRAAAVERAPERLALIAENAQALGAPQLDIIAGSAPEALAELRAPDAVFIGGGLGGAGVFEACWQALRPGGRLVANVVTLGGEARLAALYQDHGGELVRLSVERAGPVGKLTGWRPLMSVTQWRLMKPGGEAL